MDLKEERGNNPSCFSAHLGGWSGLLDGEYCIMLPRSINVIANFGYLIIT